MNFLDEIFLDNTFRAYLIVFGTIFLILILRKFLSRYTAILLCKLIASFGTKIERKTFVALITKPLSWLIVIVSAVLIIDKLNFPPAWEYNIYGVSTETIFQKIGIILIIISFIKCLLSIIDFIALFLKEKAGTTKAKGDDQLIIFFRDFLKVFLTIAGILLLIKAGFNQNVGTLLTGLSIVGAALALAAKESLENLIASFIIFFDKPFYVDDFLKVNNVSGRVEKIGLRSTRIRTAEKTLVTVPNKQMVDSIVDNWSMRTHHRTELKIELNNNISSDTLQSIISELRSLFKAIPDVSQSHVFFSEHQRNAEIISIEYFNTSTSLHQLNEMRASINMQIKKLIEKYKLEVAPPAPVINVPIAEPLPPKQEPLI